jgi:hypothetical protein
MNDTFVVSIGTIIVYDENRNILIKGKTLIPYYFIRGEIPEDYHSLKICDMDTYDELGLSRSTKLNAVLRTTKHSEESGDLISEIVLSFPSIKVTEVRIGKTIDRGYVEIVYLASFDKNIRSWVLGKLTENKY